jgi:hypothetical protein
VNGDGGVIHTISFVREPTVDSVLRSATQMVCRPSSRCTSHCSSLLQDLGSPCLGQ